MTFVRVVLIGGILGLLTACGGNSSDGAHGAVDTTVHVAWFPHPDASVTGYNIYFGPITDTATTLAANVPVNSPGFDPQAPSVEFNLLTDLSLTRGEPVCFRLRAYNSDGLSGWSPGICRAV